MAFWREIIRECKGLEGVRGEFGCQEHGGTSCSGTALIFPESAKFSNAAHALLGVMHNVPPPPPKTNIPPVHQFRPLPHPHWLLFFGSDAPIGWPRTRWHLTSPQSNLNIIVFLLQNTQQHQPRKKLKIYWDKENPPLQKQGRGYQPLKSTTHTKYASVGP